jgi:hypothetical protein
MALALLGALVALSTLGALQDWQIKALEAGELAHRS